MRSARYISSGLSRATMKTSQSLRRVLGRHLLPSNGLDIGGGLREPEFPDAFMFHLLLRSARLTEQKNFNIFQLALHSNEQHDKSTSR